MTDGIQIKNVFIIGAMKCGTTSLYHYLIQHPEFCPCIVKEPEYFSINIPGVPEEAKKDEYINLFEFNRRVHRFTLDASTGYTKFPIEPGVSARMKKSDDLDPYFIYLVRNPFDRIESHYNFMRRDINWNAKIDSEHLINTSNYNLQLQQYEKYFDSSKILVLNFDDLKKNPEEICNKIYDFVKAEKIEIEYDLEVRNVTPLFNRTQIKIEKSTHKLTRFFPTFLRRINKKILNVLFPPKEKTKLSEAQYKSIHHILEKDMQQLQEKYKIDVTNWGF